MRVFFDSEFMEDGRKIEMLSIGMVREDGQEYYAVNAHANLIEANEWVQANVIPHLPTKERKPMDWAKVYVDAWQVCDKLIDTDHPDVKKPDQIASEIVRFVGDKPEFWGYYADYDWVLLCQLYGRMVDLPPGWPMYCLDIKQFAWMMGDPKLPDHDLNLGSEHHALSDSRWNWHAWHFLDAYANRFNPELRLSKET